MEDKLIKVDKNGTKYYADYTCQRCGGAGASDRWLYTGRTCYDCGGSGKSAIPHIYKVYTPEYQAKLDARRAKRNEKRIAELEANANETRKEWLDKHQFNENGDTFKILGDTYAIKDELKALGAKYDSFLGWHTKTALNGYESAKINISDIASETLYGYAMNYTVDLEKLITKDKPVEQEQTSDYIGNVGDKIEMTVTLDHVAYWLNKFREWEHNYTYLYSFKDDNGNVLVWQTSKGLALDDGAKVTIKGTIKEHNEYKEVKQTVLTRCKIVKGDT